MCFLTHIWKADLCGGGSRQSRAQLVVFRLFVMCSSVVYGGRALDQEMQRQTDSQTGKYTLNISISMSCNLGRKTFEAACETD